MATIQMQLLSMSQVLPMLVGILAVAIYVAYRLALPRPIPGIPYNKEAAKHIFGDVPSIIRAVSETNEIWTWFAAQAVKHNSPIIQIFGKPFAKPWVFLTDFREAQDIMMRRTMEFDRSHFVGDLFVGVIPNHHIDKLSSDPKFKANRMLVKDLMTPAFLNDVSAPAIYTTLVYLVDLWHEKVRLASGRPFSARDDIHNFAFDAILAATFPFDPENSTVSAQLQVLQQISSGLNGHDIDEAAEFPSVPNSPIFQAILTLTDSMETSMKSPMPVIAHWFLRQMPSMRKAYKQKEAYITSELDNSVKRFTEGKDEQITKCALDHIVSRELASARKENRQPVYYARSIYDELLGFLIGGLDTTSTTLLWGVKILADHPAIQKKLREELRKGFGDAVAANRQPSAKEITRAQIAYLDAVVEEINRKACTTPGNSRRTLADAIVLGHHIPKGTDVFILNIGGDSQEPPIGAIPERLRSETSQAAAKSKTAVGVWNPKDVHDFKPERWLVENNGKEEFSSIAGPMIAFGLGPRSCFGRRLAYLELRMAVVLLIWNFDFQEVPKHLNSYAAVDKLTHQPRQCYVRLTTV